MTFHVLELSVLTLTNSFQSLLSLVGLFVDKKTQTKFARSYSGH